MGVVRGIAEIVMNVRDIEAMASFYREVVGLREHARIPEEHPTIVFLEIAPIERPLGEAHPQILGLIDPLRHGPALGRFDVPERRRSSLNHVALEIDEADFVAEVARLEALGLDVVTTSFPAMRAKAMFFKDPEGNSVELIAHDSSAPD